MATTFVPQEIDAARKLKTLWDRLFPGSISDVVVWRDEDYGELRFGLRGSPWGLYRNFIALMPVKQRVHEVEIACAQTLGIAQKISGQGSSMLLSPQFASSGELGLDEFASMIEGMLSSITTASPMMQTHFTILPFPGIPLDEDSKPIPYFSVARGAIEAPPRRIPAWVAIREESKLVDFCSVAKVTTPRKRADQFGSIRFFSNTSPSLGVMLTHATDLKQIQEKKTQRSIQKCGGLMFPSFAVGPIPATNFGTIVIVFDAGIVASSLHGSILRRASQPDISLYDTDAWTPTTSSAMSAFGESAYEELSGRRSLLEVDGVPTVYALGPMHESAVGMSDADPIFSMKKLAAKAKEKNGVWGPFERSVQDAVNFEKYMGSSFFRYGYLEAKASTIVPLGNALAVVAPINQAEKAASALATMGFTGDVIGIEMPVKKQKLLTEFHGDPSPEVIHAAASYGADVRIAVMNRFPVLSL